MKPEEMKNISRGVSGDMSPDAIARRLDIASELYDLAKSLSKATRIGPSRGKSRTIDNLPTEKQK